MSLKETGKVLGPLFVLEEGMCEKCGACCKLLAFRVDKLTPEEYEFYIARGVYVIRGYVVIKYRCPQLNADNTCRIHEFKPRVCAKGQCFKTEEWFRDAYRYYYGLEV